MYYCALTQKNTELDHVTDYTQHNSSQIITYHNVIFMSADLQTQYETQTVASGRNMKSLSLYIKQNSNYGWKFRFKVEALNKNNIFPQCTTIFV